MSKAQTIVFSSLFVITFLLIGVNFDKLQGHLEEDVPEAPQYDPLADERLKEWIYQNYATKQELALESNATHSRMDNLNEIIAENQLQTIATTGALKLDIQKNNDLIRNAQKPSVATVKKENQTSITAMELKTDKTLYSLGEAVIVSGLADPLTKVYAELRGLDAKNLGSDTTITKQDGTWQIVLWIPSDSTLGDYKVKASAGSLSEERGIVVN